MSEELDDEEIVEQRRVEAQPLADDERLRIAERLVQDLRALGIDGDLAEAGSVH